MEEREITSGDYHLGCKVLTSRNQNLLNEMEAQKYFKLDVLSEQETWCLFEVMTSYQDMGSEVANKCACLLAIIVMVARSLKNKGIPIWDDALSNLARVYNRDA